MTADPLATADLHALHCGACRYENVPNARYCAGCGHALFEPCGECGRSVPLAQKFCGACGFDLQQALQQRRGEHKQRLSRAIHLANEHDYDESIALLERLTAVGDYRFGDLSRRAGETLQKIQRLKEQMLEVAQRRMQRAKEAVEKGDRQSALACLQKVPRRFLDEDSQRVLAESQSYLQRQAALKSELQASLEKKRWTTAGSLVDQLLEIEPHSASYQKLAEQLAEKLAKRAEARFARRDYRRALDCLDAIPAGCRSDQHRTARCKIETVQWLADQFRGEPFATATLGRLAQRYAKEAPHDEAAAGLVKEVPAVVQKNPENSRSASPLWHPPASCWLGGEVNLFAAPRTIDISTDPRMRQLPGRFCVATGLALQGLRAGRIDEQFAPQKHALLSSFSARRKNSCWGVDVGSSGVRAVLLRQDKRDSKPAVAQVHVAEFDTPICRRGEEAGAPQRVKMAIERMVAEVDFGTAPIFVNLPTRELINRFLKFPPVKNKQLEGLMAGEVERQLPVALEELICVRWVADLGAGSQRGRPGLISAAKKNVVDERLQLFADAGLKVSGLQADALALVNFVDHEFTDLLSGPATGGSSADATPSVAVIDAGASQTTLVIVSADTCWFRAVPSGSEDLTSLLARSTKTVASEAEKLKRDPAKLQRPAEMFAPVETKQEELRARLETIAEEARRKNDPFDIVETWCVGGAPLTHGWLRRVALSR